MAAGQGFLTTNPDTRFGVSGMETGRIVAQRFTCGGSGAQAISRIGVYGWGQTGGNLIQLALFTHDAVNDCPETIISNSQTSSVSNPDSAWGNAYFDYSTLPELTGGVDYWIVAFSDDNGQIYSYTSDGGSGQHTRTGGGTFPTMPDGDTWHSYTSRPTYSTSLYAVYSSAGGSIAPLASYYARMREG